MDDRDNIQSGDLVMMIVSSDLESSGHILNLVREEGFKGIIVTRADDAMALAREFNPQGIILKSDSEGWILFDRLKRTLDTRHIPVEIIGDKKDRKHALSLGAFAFIEEGSSDEVFTDAMQSR